MASTFINKIDLLKLAGVKSVLGIELTGTLAHLVELKDTGNVLGRSKAGMQAVRSLRVPLEAGMLPGERGVRIREALEAAGCLCKYAVSSVCSRGVKTVTATVHVDVADLDDWIRENIEKLLKVPVPLKELCYSYEVVEDVDTGICVEIGFARTSDVDQHRQLIKAAGLELIGLSIGARDAMLPYLLQVSGGLESFTLVHCEDTGATVLRVKDGLRLPVQKIIGKGSAEEFFESGSIDEGYILGGLVPGHSDPARCARPFGLAPEFTLAAGLAVKGKRSELSSMDVLGEAGREQFTKSLYKAIVRRTIVILGVCLSLLLAGPIVAQRIMQNQLERVEEAFSALGLAYDEVRALEQEVQALQSRLQGSHATTGRSNVTQLLHDLATAIPDSVWLNSLGYRATKISLQGKAINNERIARLMRSLQSTHGIGQVRLIRSGSPGHNDRVVPTSGSFAIFHISSVRE